MSRSLSTSGQLADLTWSAGHPLRPRLSRARRWTMAVLLVVLWAAILGYWFITDANRVRRLAEQSLSELVGGRVKVGSATMSIFEGLRLDDVRVFAGDRSLPDAEFFTARNFLVRVDLKRLLAGELQPTRIVAIDPRVRLTQCLETGGWNYQRLKREDPASRPSTDQRRATRLPEILLRNARVEYSQLESGALAPRGVMTIEAQLTPEEQANLYRFRLQSRGGATDTMGPRVVGFVSLATGRVEARLHHFEFGQDVKTMLPEAVRKWWEDHQLAGRVDVPQLSYIPGEKDAQFTARVTVDGVTLTIQPHEGQSDDEIWRRRQLTQAFGLLRATGACEGWSGRIEWLIEPQPITLQDVHGTFTFTPEGIRLSDVIGRVEGNPIRINGRIDGYSPDAPIDLAIASLEDEPITLPPSPRYINSLPPQARETYDHLRPVGKAAMKIRLERPTRGARVEAQGEIDVLDGAFTFDKFPYPVGRATGRIVFGPDAKRGLDRLELIGLKGYGLPDGPNASSLVQVDGLIAPLSVDPEVDIRIRGREISSEPALMRAFPPMTRRALASLDAPGQGLLPKFRGDFVCEVYRPAGPKQPWTTRVDIDIHDGEGALTAFPYHMAKMTGRLQVRDDHVRIINATMRKEDGASLTIDGRVDWGGAKPTADRGALRGAETRAEPSVRPKLSIVARNAPIDDNLLNALPETHRAWLRRIGLQGRIDLRGDVTTAPGPDGQPSLDFEFSVNLRDGAVRPVVSSDTTEAAPAGEQANLGGFAVTDVSGGLRIRPNDVQILEVRGRRGDAHVSANGSIAWASPAAAPIDGGQTAGARLELSIDATNLLLDAPLYRAIPAVARDAWDLVRPDGTVDAKVLIAGDVVDPAEAASGASAAPAYEVTLLPRKLSVHPTVFPCKFTDVTGRVTITPERVDLTDLIARRGESRVQLGGGGDLASGAWNLTLSADDLTIDPELTAALPPALGDVVKSSALSGAYDVRFSRLRIVRDTAAAPRENATSPATTAPAFDELDFACRLETRDGALVAGVPMKNLIGFAEFAGTSRRGKLGDLVGRIGIDSVSLGEIAVRRLSANFEKSADSDAIRLGNLRCEMAGGQVAGDLDWTWPDAGSPRYGLSLVVRDADVQKLGIENAAPDFSGRLTASVALEGAWDDPRSRRGRGDVLVEGREMYRIPLLLGLFQITNLSLPITSPFTQATARYGIEGNRLTFEAVELSADQMKMTGSGFLDFAEKKVRMTFVTDSTTWPKVPIVGDLLQNARHELLQIHVRGSLEEPKVSAGSFKTITTTIDETFRGDGR